MGLHGATPRVSVVIPTFNRPWGLARALEGALGQTFANIEVIVADDHSEADTRALVDRFPDPRVHYFRQPENVGVARNWSSGLARARGEFVALLMDDDHQLPDFVARRLAALQADASLAVAFSSFAIHDRDGHPVGQGAAPLPDGATLAPAALLKAALARQWYIGSALYRRQALLQVWESASTAGLVLDFSLNVRLALSGQWRGVYLDSPDLVMTAHAEQLSKTRTAETMRATHALLESLLAGAPPRPLARLLHRELANWQVVWARQLAAAGQGAAARRRLLSALRADPTCLWAWWQLFRAVTW